MNNKSRLKRFWNSGLLYDLTTDTGRMYTRKINPKLGLLGFCGFLGFLGFFPDLFGGKAFPFIFFAFFGFFGFYYEGKMSDTLMDERFKLNAYRAEALANKISLVMIIFSTMLILRLEKIELVLNFLIALIGLAFGFSLFLQQYLLYRFENEE